MKSNTPHADSMRGVLESGFGLDLGLALGAGDHNLSFAYWNTADGLTGFAGKIFMVLIRMAGFGSFIIFSVAGDDVTDDAPIVEIHETDGLEEAAEDE